MTDKAIKFIAQKVVNLQQELKRLEDQYMAFDCTFSSPRAEKNYCEKSELCRQLEMLCCRKQSECDLYFESLREIKVKFIPKVSA